MPLKTKDQQNTLSNAIDSAKSEYTDWAPEKIEAAEYMLSALDVSDGIETMEDGIQGKLPTH